MGTERRQEAEADMSEEMVGERKEVCKLCCSSRKGILSVDVLLSAHGLTSHYFCLLFRSDDDCDEYDVVGDYDYNDDNCDFNDYVD